MFLPFLRSIMFLLCVSPFLLHAQTIVWLSDWQDTDSKTLTMDEQTRDLIFSEINGVSVELQQESANRSLLRVRDEDNVCVGDRVYNNERAEYSLASLLPQVVVPGLKFYVLNSFVTKHGISPLALSNLSLPEILAQYPRMRVGAVADRSYGKVIDNVLAREDLTRRVWKRSSSDMGEGVIDMLASERIDAIFEYPPLFEKVRIDKNLPADIHAVSVKGIPKFGLGFVLCSRSPEGERAIAEISNSIAQVSKQRAYLDIHLAAMPEAYRKEMLMYYNQVYGTNFAWTASDS